MNLVLPLYTALLFVVLTPGILLTLPKGGSKLTVAAVHGLVFAVVLYFTAKFVVDLTTTEGFGNFLNPANRGHVESRNRGK
jgi:hypothetical protein